MNLFYDNLICVCLSWIFRWVRPPVRRHCGQSASSDLFWCQGNSSPLYQRLFNKNFRKSKWQISARNRFFVNFGTPNLKIPEISEFHGSWPGFWPARFRIPYFTLNPKFWWFLGFEKVENWQKIFAQFFRQYSKNVHFLHGNAPCKGQMWLKLKF